MSDEIVVLLVAKPAEQETPDRDLAGQGEPDEGSHHDAANEPARKNVDQRQVYHGLWKGDGRGQALILVIKLTV